MMDPTELALVTEYLRVVGDHPTHARRGVVVAAVLRHQHFTAAAQELGVSRSAVHETWLRILKPAQRFQVYGEASIHALPLSTRAVTVLERLRIKMLVDLRTLSVRDVLVAKNSGRLTTTEILSWMRALFPDLRNGLDADSRRYRVSLDSSALAVTPTRLAHLRAVITNQRLGFASPPTRSAVSKPQHTDLRSDGRRVLPFAKNRRATRHEE